MSEDIDQIIRDLVEWKDGWEWHEDSELGDGFKTEDEVEHVADCRRPPEDLKNSLDLVRELEVAVCKKFKGTYGSNLSKTLLQNGCNSLTYIDMAMADPKPRLIALHRTLKEAGEIE